MSPHRVCERLSDAIALCLQKKHIAVEIAVAEKTMFLVFLHAADVMEKNVAIQNIG
jgi:hypothetical protein